MFDGVGSHNVVEHLEDIDRAIAEMVRVAKPGGLIFVCAPNLLSPKYPLDTLRHGGRMTFEGRKSIVGLFLMFARNALFLTLKKIGAMPTYPQCKPMLSALPTCVGSLSPASCSSRLQ